MKAAVINRYGSPDVLEIKEISKPEIGKDDILIEVHATSINPVDWKIRSGSLKILTGRKFPKILGGDVAGIVLDKGQNVTLFNTGDEVYGKLNAFKGGSYAEYASVWSNQIGFKPKNLNFNQSATLPLAGLTAMQSLVDYGGLKKGKRVLINGASGGVGVVAVQFSKALNAIVTGVCSGRNVEFVKSLGADNVVDYNNVDISEMDQKFDIFFDAVAKSSFGTAKKVLDKGGIYITTVPNFTVMILGPLLNPFSSRKMEKIMVRSNPGQLKLMKEMVEAGDIVPIIDKVFPLSEIADAHREAEKGRTVGKIVVSIKD